MSGKPSLKMRVCSPHPHYNVTTSVIQGEIPLLEVRMGDFR